MATHRGITMHILVILIVAGLAIGLATGLFTPIDGQRSAQRAAPVRDILTAEQAHAKALSGEVVLVDIRSPEEWRATGVPATAHAISMHQDPAKFRSLLLEATGGDTGRALALICHSGSRSVSLQKELVRGGFERVYDVSEGMIGGWGAGPGWLKRQLPLRRGAKVEQRPDVPRHHARPAL